MVSLGSFSFYIRPANVFGNRHLQLFIWIFMRKSRSCHQLLYQPTLLKIIIKIQGSDPKRIKLSCWQFSLRKAVEIRLISEVSTGGCTNKLLKWKIKQISLLNQRCEVFEYYLKLVNKSVLWNVKKLWFRLKSRQRLFFRSAVIDLKFLLGNLQRVAEIQPKCTGHKIRKSILLR